MEGRRKRCKSQWSVKYRSRSPSQGTCGVHTLRRSTMQGLVVDGLTDGKADAYNPTLLQAGAIKIMVIFQSDRSPR